MNTTNIGVSIIIVNYNTRDELHNCILSVYEHTKAVTFEIIVSDNGSTDGSVEMIQDNFPKVILIKNNANLGFGKANNNGLNIAKGKYIFYLNSDTVLLNNAIKIFYDYWENYPDSDLLGAIGCNLINKNYEITSSWGDFFYFWGDLKQLICHYIYLIFISIGIKRQKKARHLEHFGDVDIIVGAALFMKNNKDACFDERFFLYHEEADLAFTLSKKNKKRILIKGPRILHLEGKSNKTKGLSAKYKDYYSFSRIHDYLSRIKYHRKNNNRFIYVFLLKMIVLLIFLYPPLLSKTRYYIKDLLII